MVVREVERFVAAGAREITLLGQNVNSYGKDLYGEGAMRTRVPTFPELLRAVDAVPGLERVRFTTSHPMDAIDDLIALFGSLRTLCEFFHLPVQAGNDRVLEEMRRYYTVADYRDKITKLRAACPDIALSTDIIVGFPGETDAEFEDTLKLLAEVRYDSIFAFKYSERPGTRAAGLGDSVPEPVKKARLAQVQALQDAITRDKMVAMGGKVVEILVEGPSQRAAKGEGNAFQMMGRTRTNLIVNVPVPFGEFWNKRWVGKLATVEVVEVKANTLFGRFV
jgi:tRNA-2-methylthio-N6-dimethylallyladenosine synthase